MPNLRQVHLLHAEILDEVSADGTVQRRAGVMAVVRRGGVVRPGDRVGVRLPDGEHLPLQAV